MHICPICLTAAFLTLIGLKAYVPAIKAKMSKWFHKDHEHKDHEHKDQRNIMKREEVSKKVFERIESDLGIESHQITEDSRFVEDCGADSLDTVELVMHIEDDFHLEISDEKANSVKTIGEAIDLVYGMLS